MGKRLPDSSAIAFYDADPCRNTRLWQEMSEKTFGMLTQGFSYKQILTLVTVPD